MCVLLSYLPTTPRALTSGGGRPPAPAGQSGSIFFLPSQLHMQAGEGSSMVQFLELKSSRTLSGTSGVYQSSSPIVQGASLQGGGEEETEGRKKNVVRFQVSKSLFAHTLMKTSLK